MLQKQLLAAGKAFKLKKIQASEAAVLATSTACLVIASAIATGKAAVLNGRLYKL
jgi:hypothetical protein